jgi:hypothetical protein
MIYILLLRWRKKILVTIDLTLKIKKDGKNIFKDKVLLSLPTGFLRQIVKSMFKISGESWKP